MKVKGLIAAVCTLLLVLVLSSIKLRHNEPPKIEIDEPSNVVKYVEVGSEKYHVHIDPNRGLVELRFIDRESGELFFAFDIVHGQNRERILAKAASLNDLRKRGEGRYLLRLALEPMCERYYYLKAIELFEGQSEHRIVFENEARSGSCTDDR